MTFRFTFTHRADRWWLSTVVIAGVLLLAPVARTRADDWESYQHDPQRTGFSTSALNPATLSLRWTAPQGFTDPIVVGNSVIAIERTNSATAPATVDSFNIANGALNWSTSVNYSSSLSNVAYGGGMLAFETQTTSGSFITSHLNVANATTGAVLYSTVVPEYDGFVTMATDTTTNQPVAYVSTGNDGYITAVRLGAASGTTLWTVSGINAGGAAPSVAGNLLLSASVDQYYAINRTTGAVNQFYQGMDVGGGGYSPVVDATRSQFYILGGYRAGQTPVNTLTAYSYSGSTIKQLWQLTGAGIGSNNTPALDANGNLYVADTSTLEEINPTTGKVIRSITGSFSVFNAPIITNNYLWEFGPANVSATYAYVYNLTNLSLAATIQVGSLDNAVYNTAALEDTHFIEDFGGSDESPGVEVFAGTDIPEPGCLGMVSLAAISLLIRRRKGLLAAGSCLPCRGFSGNGHAKEQSRLHPEQIIRLSRCCRA